MERPSNKAATFQHAGVAQMFIALTGQKQHLQLTAPKFIILLMVIDSQELRAVIYLVLTRCGAPG